MTVIGDISIYFIFEHLIIGPSYLSQSTAAPNTNLLNFFKPTYHNEDYYPSGGSNIDRLVNSLTRSGAQRAKPDSDGLQTLWQSFFGK